MLSRHSRAHAEMLIANLVLRMTPAGDALAYIDNAIDSSSMHILLALCAFTQGSGLAWSIGTIRT